MSAIADRLEPGPGVYASRYLLARASDERLIREMRKGSELALEIAYERHSRGLLAMCRHILGSRDDAEEALQHSFTAAWSSVRRTDRPGPKLLKPWLYAIARNRCLSMIRARQPNTVELQDVPSRSGLSDELEHRDDLREMLRDLNELPEDQRTALVLTEFSGFSHLDVARVLGRREQAVKALVFQARTTLGHWREAREVSCQEIREQLATLSGGALRRRALQGHLRTCEGCRDFRAGLRQQRSALAIILPVIPSFKLSYTALAGAGIAKSAGGGLAGVGVGAGIAASAGGGVSGLGAGALVPLGSAAALAVIGGLAFSLGHETSRLTPTPPTTLQPASRIVVHGPGGRATTLAVAPARVSTQSSPALRAALASGGGFGGLSQAPAQRFVGAWHGHAAGTGRSVQVSAGSTRTTSATTGGGTSSGHAVKGTSSPRLAGAGGGGSGSTRGHSAGSSPGGAQTTSHHFGSDGGGGGAGYRQGAGSGHSHGDGGGGGRSSSGGGGGHSRAADSGGGHSGGDGGGHSSGGGDGGGHSGGGGAGGSGHSHSGGGGHSG